MLPQSRPVYSLVLQGCGDDNGVPSSVVHSTFAERTQGKMAWSLASSLRYSYCQTPGMGPFLSCSHVNGMALEPGWHTGQSRVLCSQPWEPHGRASTLDTTQFQRLPSSMGPADCVPMGLCLSHGHAGPRPALYCPVYQCPTLRGSEEMRSEPRPGPQWEPGSAPKSLCCWTNASLLSYVFTKT